MKILLIILPLLLPLSYCDFTSNNTKFEGNPYKKHLFDDLLSNYNRLIRPVQNHSENLTVWMGLKLTQLTEMNLKSQVMTTSVWLIQKWFDCNLKWDPKEYGGLDKLYVPSDHIWLPDIVLFNNADGNYEVTLMTKAVLKYTGEVLWSPPAIYKSYCEINVLYFPFDEQNCYMMFGSWTYNGNQVDLRHIDQSQGRNRVDVGIDLSEFYLSVEWDLLEVPAIRNEEFYSCCSESYTDITFNIKMRRKTLFYTVNLIIPCVGLTFMTVLVFYLPSDSGEKVTLCSNILVSLTVFFLLLAEIIPPTSLAVPLLGKYLLFTMVLVSMSIGMTVVVLNIHFRSPSTHTLSPWVRTVFLHMMPQILMMRRPPYSLMTNDGFQSSPGYFNELDYSRDSISDSGGTEQKPPSLTQRHWSFKKIQSVQPHNYPENVMPKTMSPDLLKALQGVCYIAQHIKDADKDKEVIEDWKYVSMVFDRFFLWVFTLACIVGTCAIIFQAPSLYDQRQPIDFQLSSIPRRRSNLALPHEIDFYERTYGAD
uniref:Nicotinic acetylcholine receptor alpha 4 subunit n=2 Tax=Rhopalosiphum padi TaxID=40932 RepID=A0A0U2GQE8_RHOPD|nr:nicotinic acetylcholine receptor alpha 4 subunit [Rhopalosiphum padi]